MAQKAKTPISLRVPVACNTWLKKRDFEWLLAGGVRYIESCRRGGVVLGRPAGDAIVRQTETLQSIFGMGWGGIVCCSKAASGFGGFCHLGGDQATSAGHQGSLMSHRQGAPR